ncbi:Crp/Fnr family transcriptional regulator [Nocardia sp. SSK8]|uniref:Crp/Fnr family transcriptional regulator n=1 Tax=Nocardia sp. SSK8 TaxID=3120154 RepID=UPI00300AB123
MAWGGCRRPGDAAARQAGHKGECRLDSDELSRFSLEALLDAGTRRQWSTGSALMNEGDRSDHVVIIHAGRVKVTSAAESGKQVLLAIRGPGDLLGEFSAIDGRARSATVTALSAVSATVVPGQAFRAMLRTDGRAAFAMLQVVIHRLREADVQRLEYGAHTVTERVSRLLLDYAARYGQADDDRVVITLPLTQDELAHAAGASREAVAKSLRLLRDRKAVRTGRRRIELLQLGLLAELAGGVPSVYSDADGPGRPERT